MTLSDLIQELEDIRDGGMDEDIEVVFSYNYGDHWNSVVAANVTSIDEGIVKYSDYHRMFKVEEDEVDVQDVNSLKPFNDRKGPKQVLIISS